MAIYPGAIRKLIPRHNRIRSGGQVRMNLHVAVSEAASLHGYFSGVGVCSHFYVRKDGTVEQYIDTAYKSSADLEGNSSTISVETQGGLRNAQSEPWTQAQLVALAGLFAWAVKTHGIPARLARDSRPGESSKGLSWHRLGIDPWRVSGGMKYSNSRGKVCPGDAKIAQIPTILATATATLAGNTTRPGGPLPNPNVTLPDPLEEDDVAWDDVLKNDKTGTTAKASTFLTETNRAVFETRAAVDYVRRQNLVLEAQHKALDQRIVAVSANLAGAIAATAGGEPFDEAKLLDGIRASVREGTAAAAPEVAKAAADAVRAALADVDGVTTEQIETALRSVFGSLDG